MWAIDRCVIIIRRHIINSFLAFLHSSQIIRQGLVLIFTVAVGCCKPQQLGDLVLICKVFSHTLFDDLAKLAPEGLILLRLFLR